MIRTIDFNNLASGDNVTDQFGDLGVRVSATANGNGVDQAMIFDSNNPTGGDDDLATDNLDNVLIISEDGDSSDPDDNRFGGTFAFDFDSGVTVKSLTLIDIEETARLVFFDEAGNVIGEQFVPATGDNGQVVVELSVPGTSRFEVVLAGSGAVDNLVFEDNVVAPVEQDGIVSGDDEANVIDLDFLGDPEGDRIDAGDALLPGEAADDDIVDALGGNDTVTSLEGDDEIFAGSGDDVVSGGAGNDVIFGDRTLADGDTPPEPEVSGARESFNWSGEGFTSGETIDDFTQDTGTVNVTFTTVSATPKTTTAFSTDAQRTDGIDGEGEAVSTTSSLSSETRAAAEAQEYALEFDAPVTNVDFNINDIDGDSTVTVLAFDAAGNPLPVTLVAGDALILSDSDGINGTDTATSDGNFADATNPIYSLNVDIAGPVSRIEISHTQFGDNGTSVNITDVFFTTGAAGVVGESNDDLLFGDAGDDQIFGETGSDTISGGTGDDVLQGGTGNDNITGGEGADFISGGDDADLIIGGTAGDTVDGGTGQTTGLDQDTLDLTGVGDFRLVDVTRDADGDSDSGTVEFLDADGNVTGTLAFTEIETILGDPVVDNTPPVAVDDTATTDEDTAVIVDLRGNDIDAEDATAALAISDITVPAEQGSVVDNGDGTVTFTPALNFNGEATITYTVTDTDGLSDEGQAIVTVTPVNDAPDAADDADATAFNTPITVNLLANDTDVENPADLVVTAATVPAEQGTLELNGDGTALFTPADGFTGEATISYTIADPEGLTDSAVHVVTVEQNLGPTAFDDVAETPQNTAVIVDLRGNDFDPNDATEDLVLSDISVPAEQGTVVDNGDGTVTFTPAPGFNGDATITYTVTDPTGLSDEGQAIVTVLDPQAPQAFDDGAATPEETPVVVDLRGNDFDPDNALEDLVISDITVPAEQGSVVDNGDGTVTFTPAPNFNGEATITYTVTDPDGLSDTGEAVVTVTPVNDAPDAVDDADTTAFNTPITVDLLANDTDVENPGDLIVTAATVPAEQGTLELNEDGTALFTPADGFTGEATISYTIADPEGLTDSAVHVVTVAENDENFSPVAVDDTADTDEETTVTIDVLGNDTDPEDDPLTVIEATSPDGTVVINDDGTLDFTPNPDFFGEAVIDYTVTDGNGGIDDARVFVTVENVNDDPIATDDVAATDLNTPVTIPVLGNDVDPDGDDLTVTEATSPDGAVVINDDGTLTFTPNDGFEGDAVIDYTITDGNGGTDTAQVAVSVNQLNGVPVAEDDMATTPEDTPVIIDVLANDSDPEDDDLTVTEATSPDGEVTINEDGTLEFTPAPDFNGPTTITYTITDGNGGTDTATVDVTVTPVNDGPLAEDDNAATDPSTPVTVAVLANDSDPEGDPLTVVFASSPDGEVVINDDGTLTFTPADGFLGEAQVNYTISDGELEDPAVLFVEVGDNLPPVTMDDTAETNQDTPVIIDVLANDFDPNGDPLTVIAAVSPNGDVTINDDGTLTFTPDAGFNGPAEITYTVSDGRGGETPGTVNVLVSDGIVTGTDGDDLIDEDFDQDPEGDVVDGGDGFLPGEGPEDDIINAGDGDDTVIAGEGDDEVDGGAGDDSIDGGPGDDDLTGGDGSDTVAGSEGDDIIDTSGGTPLPDIGFPGVFDPDPDPEDDRDSVDGGPGDDTITTGDDRDTINGGPGDDVIDAGFDDDIIDGGPGDDRIVGGEGNDSILGSGGDDTIFANNDPDLGLDVLELENDGSNPLGPDLAPDNGNDTVDGGTGDDLIFGGDDDDLLIGASGNDTLDGGIDDDTLQGGTGDDSLIGGQGDDSLTGGQGEDTLEGGIGDDTLRGNLDDDLLDGGDGDDLLDGGGGDDVLLGGDGEDTLMGATGDDTLSGGDGDDELDGGQGDDILNGDAGDDTLIGTLGDDELRGGDGDDSILGGSGNDTILGNAGNDTLIGGNDQDDFLDVNPGDVVDGSEGGDDFDELFLEGSAPEGGSLQVTLDGDNPENGVVDFFNADGTDAGQLVFTNIERVVPCFTPGTLIATPKGERKVEDLQVGDRIITRDNGMQEIRWIGRREMSGEELVAKEHLRPVLIQQGALGNGLPERDMMVSPQHRVLVANDKTALYFEEREVLVAAKHLTDMDGIDVVDVSHTTYIHIMFDQHEVILSDGTWTESFQPGDMSLAGVGDASREEILELFPELATREGIEAYAAARKSLKKHEAKLITGKS